MVSVNGLGVKSSTLAVSAKRKMMEEKEKEAFYVFKKDLSKWLKAVTKEDISPENFLSKLDTGILLCHLAKSIQETAKIKREKGENDFNIPMDEIRWNKITKKESFQARDNASNFIAWCRKLGIRESLLFESEGLVLHRDEKRVILTLMAVARIGGKLGMIVPVIVEMEKEIDRMNEEDENKEGEREKNEDAPKAKRRKKETLDEKVLMILHDCKCPTALQAVSYGCGKFHITTPLGRQMTIYIRVLQEHVMVRVGGGWDTLEHFLLKFDPCRSCASISALSVTSVAPPKSSRLVATPNPWRPITGKFRVSARECGLKESISSHSI